MRLCACMHMHGWVMSVWGTRACARAAGMSLQGDSQHLTTPHVESMTVAWSNLKQGGGRWGDLSCMQGGRRASIDIGVHAHSRWSPRLSRPTPPHAHVNIVSYRSARHLPIHATP